MSSLQHILAPYSWWPFNGAPALRLGRMLYIALRVAAELMMGQLCIANTDANSMAGRFAAVQILSSKPGDPALLVYLRLYLTPLSLFMPNDHVH
jgi:hypothetical protein